MLWNTLSQDIIQAPTLGLLEAQMKRYLMSSQI